MHGLQYAVNIGNGNFNGFRGFAAVGFVLCIICGTHTGFSHVENNGQMRGSFSSNELDEGIGESENRRSINSCTGYSRTSDEGVIAAEYHGISINEEESLIVFVVCHTDKDREKMQGKNKNQIPIPKKRQYGNAINYL